MTREPDPAPLSVAGALRLAAQAGVDRLDAQLMLADLLGCRRTWLLAHDDAALDPANRSAWQQRVARRADGEPLAYLLGAKEFFGLLLQVGPAVLVPRPETETLVEWALEILRPGDDRSGPPQVADLGCGSGAIALAIKHRRRDAELTAVDASAAALEIAAANGRRLGLEVNWLLSDWWHGLGERQFDLVVSNPPYIADRDSHLPALRYEPIEALTAGSDGLTALRRISADAPAHLRPGGWLLFEHSFEQADAVADLLQRRGFTDVTSRSDLARLPRCSGGRWPGPLPASHASDDKSALPA